MQDKIKQRVLGAFLLVMRPIVRILLRYGIGFREFAEVTKTAFVDVASSDFGLRGRPTNISRVAVMTGLTRKEVSRLREKIEKGDSSVSVKSTPLADVLHEWYARAEFIDSSGSPLSLPFSGSENSFSSLVKKVGGDIPAGAMRTEMKRVGAIREDESGLLSVIKRTIRLESDDETLVTVLVHGAYALLTNIAHNTNPARPDVSWANRVAYTKTLGDTDAKQLRRISKDRVVDFAESIDDLFMAYESLHDGNGGNGGDGDEAGRVVAVGIYYFEEDDKNVAYDW